MRLIKKYKNRRLYDTDLKKNITFDDIKKYVMNDIDLKIIDNTTGEDITISVLANIMGEQSHDFKNSGLKIANTILKKGGVAAMDIFKKLTLASIGAANMTKERLEELFDEMVKKGEMTNDEKAQAIKGFVDKSVEMSEKAKVYADDIAKKVSEKFSAKFDQQISQLAIKLEEVNTRIAELEKKLNIDK